MPSILSGNYADLLLSKLPSDHTVAELLIEQSRYASFLFTVRRRSRLYQVGWHQPSFSFAADHGLTGGLQLTATAIPEISVLKSPKFVVNLKPGWTEAGYRRAFNRLADKALKEKGRLTHVVVCHQVSAPYSGNSDFLAAVEEHEKTCKHTVEYDKMSIEDADYWTAWVRNWKN